MLEAIQFLLPAFVGSLAILAILSYLGLHVLEREIIFIDIALAQIAVTGATVALIIFGHDHHDEGNLTARVFSIAFTFIAAAFFSFVSKKVKRISQETVIGVSYAIAAAATLFLLATAAGGDVHFEEMLTGSLLWIEWTDVIHFSMVYAAVGLLHFLFRSRFIKVTVSYGEAEREGVNVMWWDFLFYALMGLVITYTVEYAGVLLTFSYLIIPATFSAMLAKRWSLRLIYAWGLGLFSMITGLTFSFKTDFPCGPSLVTVMGIVLALTAVITHLFGKAARE